MALPSQTVSRLRSELFDELDAVDMLCQQSQDRRLIAQPGPDLQHRIRGPHIEQVGHDGNDEGLRDRLAEADRHRRVGVGVRPQFQRNEFVARYPAHDIHDPRAQRSLAQTGTCKNGPGRDLREHALAQLREFVVAHDASRRKLRDCPSYACVQACA